MELRSAVDALAALAQPSRLELFRILVRQGPLGLPAGQIGARLGIPAATLSFHLSHLNRTGLVTKRRLGRSILYAADYAGMQALLDYLMENCCQAEGGACGPVAAPREKEKKSHGNEGVRGHRARSRKSRPPGTRTVRPHR